jgi:subtilisin family serine protease
MAKRSHGSRSGSRRASEGLEPSESTSPSMEHTIDFDERSQSLPLEGPTGRTIATMSAGDAPSFSSAVAAISKDFSLSSICDSRDFAGPMDSAQMDDAQVIVFQDFNIAVFKSDPDKRTGVMDLARSRGMVAEPEYWNHPLGMQHSNVHASVLDGDVNPRRRPESMDYFRGLRDGLSSMLAALEQPSDTFRGLASAASFSDSAAATWGLQATGATGTTRSGLGVRVAVLDTGFDTTHPDFAGRAITSRSFIPPTTTDRNGNLITLTDLSATIDQSGHGTHCIGTACGPQNPASGPRYGIAHDAEIFNGKVMSVIPGTNRASGADAWIIDGIRWAIQEGCSIISLSLGSEVRPGDPISAAFETLAKSAFENGILIVAAAGNDSDRNGIYPPFFSVSIRPVARPANCPHIVAVAAVDPMTNTAGTLTIANFSNRHMIDDGGEVNLSGPGVAILSSFPQPRHQLLDGTSQATPHVAGIAALVQQETGKKGKDLYFELRNRVVPQGSRVDYGNGLIHV